MKLNIFYMYVISPAVFLLVYKVINTLMKAVSCSHRAAADFATTVDREVR